MAAARRAGSAGGCAPPPPLVLQLLQRRPKLMRPGQVHELCQTAATGCPAPLLRSMFYLQMWQC
jgi:hypothetical protein